MTNLKQHWFITLVALFILAFVGYLYLDEKPNNHAKNLASVALNQHEPIKQTEQQNIKIE